MNMHCSARGLRMKSGYGVRWLPALLVALTAQAVSAATLTWTGGVAGVWQNGAAGWLNGGSPANWNSATPDAAWFGGLGTGSVSVQAGGVTVGNFTVTQGVYAVDGTGVLTLQNATLTVEGAALTTTVSAALGGTSGFTKSGSGELVLSGTNKSYTGQTTLSGGVVRITATGPGSLGTTATNGVNLMGGALHALFSANVNVSNFLVVGAAGGELRNLGTDAQRWVMMANQVYGTGTLTLAFGTQNTRFTLANAQNNFSGKWIINSGGNVNRFVDMNYTSGNGFGGATGDDAITLENSAGVLIRNGLALGSASQGITLGSGRAKISVASTSTGTIAGKISGPATNSVQFYLDNANSVMILSNTANSWAGAAQINAGGAFGTVQLGAAGVIPDASLLELAATGRLDLNGYAETIGGLTGPGRVDNAAASSSATLLVGANNASTNFTGSMTNSGAGASLSLIKVGTGTWTLNTTSLFYSGSTVISGGVLQITSSTNGTLGASMTNLVRINGGALYGGFTNNQYVLFRWDIGPLGAELRNIGNDSQRWIMHTPANGITGSGTVSMTFGSDISRFEFTNNQSTFTGKWIVDGGGNNNRLIDFYHGGAFGAGTGDTWISLVNSAGLLMRPNVTLGSANQGITLGGGQSYIEIAGFATGVLAGKLVGPSTNTLWLQFENQQSVMIVSNTANSWLGATTLANTGTLRIGVSGVVPDAGGTWTLQPAVTLDLYGNREVIGGLTGSGNIENRSPATSAMLGIGGNGASTTFSGALSNSAAGASLGLTKLGSGTLTLSSSQHNYSGSTAVSGGVLLVTGTLPSSSLADVAAGTLAGSFSMGPLRVRGGRVSPGNTSIGSMNASSLVFTGGTFRLDVNAISGTPGVNWDLLTVGGGAGFVTNDTSPRAR
jgi:fibronectin-binding autotransporter adhesin